MLEAIGLMHEHERVYRALLGAPHSTPDDLASATGLRLDRVAGAVCDLERLGFLTRAVGTPDRLVPVRPDAAVEAVVAQRRLELDQVTASARVLVEEMRVHDQHRPDRLLEVVTGEEAIASRFAQLLNGTVTQLRVLDRPPYAARPANSQPKVLGLLGSGVRVRGIYSPESLAVPGAVEDVMSAREAGEESRVHPAVPMKLAVFDAQTALLPLSADRLVDSALVVHRSALLDALGQMFELLWTQAVPIHDSPADEVDGRLLTLLAAGLKDEAIARQLRLSPRTIGRKISDLMGYLGARTRFQAGLYAERRRLTAAHPDEADESTAGG